MQLNSQEKGSFQFLFIMKSNFNSCIVVSKILAAEFLMLTKTRFSKFLGNKLILPLKKIAQTESV